jgi:polar amino acid transport system substrate-binding protein
MRRTLRLPAVIAVAGLIFAACSSAATTAPTVAPTAAAPAPASVAPSEAPSVAPTVDPNSLLGKIISSGTLRVSTDPNYAPFSSLNTATNTYEGFDTSTAEETVKRLSAAVGKDIKIDWQTPSWDLITAGSWAGRWDISIGSMSVTVGRAKVVDFTDPYYYDFGSIAVPTGSTVQTLADLNGKTVCVGAATTYEQWLTGKLEIVDPTMLQPPTGLKLTSLPTDNECIQALAAGRKFDAIVANENDLANAVKQNQPIRLLTGIIPFKISVAFALDKSGAPDASLIALLNPIIAAMHADGTLTALSIKWLGKDVTTAP